MRTGKSSAYGTTLFSILTFMYKLLEKITEAQQIDDSLTLPYELRVKSRFRANLDSGYEVGIVLPRGSVLLDGDLLRSDQGYIVKIKAANEKVSTATTSDPLLLSRVCYHLGNRHVALQISGDWIRYQHDHVLDDMVKSLGLKVLVEDASFEPEVGAYSNHGTHKH